MTRLRRLVARALARDLAAFIVPDPVVARLAGLDLSAAGLRIVPTPRHANVLLLVGPIPESLARAAGVAYAQMPRPKAILAAGAAPLPGLPEPDVVTTLDQHALVGGVADLRRTFAAGAFSTDVAQFDIEAVQTRTQYVCPMHPEIVQDTPGACPICGMNLVPREAAGPPAEHDHAVMTMDQQPMSREGAEAAEYTCPMHPEVVQDTPGSCPICGMRLVLHEPLPAEQAAGDETVYTCPMHPEIIQSEPGRCPICGMNLVPRAEAGDQPGASPPAAHADHTPSRETSARPQPAHTGHAGHDMRAMATAEHAGHDGEQTTAERTHEHQARTPREQTSPPAAAEHGLEHAGHDMARPQETGHAGHPMGQSGGTIDHAAHRGGFMSMVAMTKDLPRSDDGLPMEWVETPFGPLFPGLPGGLRLTLTLDGDTVVRARLGTGATSRDLAAALRGPAAGLPRRLDDLDRLAPGAYGVLAAQALDPDAADDARRARVATLERSRAISHLGWLSAFCTLLGDRWLAERAGTLHLAAVRAVSRHELEGLHEQVTRLRRHVERLPLPRHRLAGIGRLGHAHHDVLRGPVTRAVGMADDARRDDPHYAALGFEPVLRDGGDALARLLVRLAEIEQSLALASAIGGDGRRPLIADGHLPGSGGATLELPRGRATLHVMGDDGTVSGAHLDTPSATLAALVPAVAEGVELADALLAVASLDLSPWEIDS